MEIRNEENTPQEAIKDEPANTPEQARDFIRRLSRIYLAAAEKNKISLVDTLTAQNHETMEFFLNAQPIFYQETQENPKNIDLEPEITDLLPPEFFSKPTQWIEAQPFIDRSSDNEKLPTGKTIKELEDAPYDISKVRTINLKDGRKIVSKRIDPKQKNEVSRARQAYAAGIPTPKVLGVIKDQGNTYAFFEHIEGKNLNAFFNGKSEFDYISPRTAQTEKEFERDMEVWESLTMSARTQLNRLWKEYREDIVIREAILKLFSMEPLDQAGYCEKINTLLKNIKIPEKIIEKIFQIVGVSSFEEIARKIKNIGEVSDDDCLEVLDHNRKTLTDLKNRAVEKYEERVLEFDRRWLSTLLLGITGCDIEGEIKRIETLCEQSGIDHKDLNRRNLILSTEIPPRLYLIDWEEENLPKT